MAVNTARPGDDEVPSDDEAPEGRLIDYISGREIAATPEELIAVQPFAKQLVEDYGYPKENIRTRPQWHVKARPSDTSKTYPVDIAVFEGGQHQDDDFYIVIECKKPDRTEGRSQLEDYMRLSRAKLGVWFNGHERLFLRKIEEEGAIRFVEIPNIPRFGQRIEDIGLYKRKDLHATHNLKSIFRSIRNFLAANAVGMTRDEALAREIMNLIFSKIYDERFTRRNSTVSFRAGVNESPEDVANRVKSRFAKVLQQYKDVFEETDQISFDDKSISYVVGELQQYCLIECERDVIADAFETFIGPSLKGPQGQFFTPRNVTALVRELVRPKVDDMILDPACGSGGFLIEGLRGLWNAIDQQADYLDWPDPERQSEKDKAAMRQLRGIDKDEFLSRVAKAYMALLGDGRGGVYCENSLADKEDWNSKTRQDIALGGYNVIMTNPPFGKKLKIAEKSILSQYSLARKWKKDKHTGSFEATGRVLDGQTPQILFIERCLDLLEEGGRLGIVLPESMLCNPSHRYIVQYILSRAKIKAVISIHENLFQPHTHAKTCVVLIEKGAAEPAANYDIFMAIARWCGHDSRGHEIPFDDIPQIGDRWRKYCEGDALDFDHLGFTISSKEIRDFIFLPKYYNPELTADINALQSTHDLVSLGDLVKSNVISVDTGHEVGKLAYGTGSIPFIRTSDIANWQVKGDPKHGLSRVLYDKLSGHQNVEPGDILMVRDGTYLVGTCAFVTDLDWKIVYQSHILKFKVLDKDVIDPYLLLALLSSPIVKRQVFAKRFTQDIIDTLGGRWAELVLPIPKTGKQRSEITESVRSAIAMRREAANLSWQAVQRVAPEIGTNVDDAEIEYDFGVINQ